MGTLATTSEISPTVDVLIVNELETFATVVLTNPLELASGDNSLCFPVSKFG